MPVLLRETRDKGLGNKNPAFLSTAFLHLAFFCGCRRYRVWVGKALYWLSWLGRGQSQSLLSGGQNMFLGLGVGSENFEGRPRGGNRQARISSWMLWNRHTADMEEHTHTHKTHNTNNHWQLPRGSSVPGANLSEVSKAQGASGTWWWSASSFGDLQRVYFNYGI